MRTLRTVGRALVLLLLAAGLVAAWLNRETFSPATLQATLASYRAAAPLLFLAAQIAASLLFIPRTLLAVAAGLLFGMAWGIVWAALGSVLGAIAGFLLARYLNDGLIEPEHVPRLGPMLRRAEDGGWRAVAGLRLIPVVPHSLANYALGLTQVSLGSYALGSFLGQLPMTIAYVDLGAAGEQMMNSKAGWIMPTAIGLLALAVSFLWPKLVKRAA